MFQEFDTPAQIDAVPGRIARLRAWLAEAGLDGMIVPRADAHQGEQVAPSDARLAWATGFTGSAGTAVILAGRAALAIDGRYTIQAREQAPEAIFEFVPVMDVKPEEWLAKTAPEGARIGFDPWLHTPGGVEKWRDALEGTGIALVRLTENPIDLLWEDRPPPPSGRARIHDDALAGCSSAEKRRDIAGEFAPKAAAAVLTQPDGIAWLLNIRGSDLARLPVVQGFAVLHSDARVELAADRGKFPAEVRAHLGNEVAIHDPSALGALLDGLAGAKVMVDRDACPVWIAERLEAAGAELVPSRDPTALPKARKTGPELAGMRAAHHRDGVAMARFLHWLDTALAAGEALDEIAIATKLEGFRNDTGALLDLSFDTISAAGPHAALPHYRVSRASNRALDRSRGEIYLCDSGAQYADGTTDITRTIAAGPVEPEARRRATLVLKGMIAISRARWPKGVAGAHLDALARIALWQQGFDYDHGTGHGVGAHLDVHEGPQNLSRRGTVPLEPGMILSNEPGYYREGHYGIRIENLVIVTPPEVPKGGEREMMGFETLTLAPIDRRLVDPALLTAAERDWLDAYHARVFAEIGPALPPEVAEWLSAVCAPL